MNVLALYPAAAPNKAWIHEHITAMLGRVAGAVPDLLVTERDLTGLAPHGAAGDLSDELVQELVAADLVVIGAPIGHHPVPPALVQWYRRANGSKSNGAPIYAMGLNPELQAWFSHVIRADRTFRYTAQGPSGLLSGKKAIVLAARTGSWHNEAMTDHQVHCIETQLRFMGIDEIATTAADRHANPVRSPRRWQARPAQKLAA
ncbi:NAD(P)H-dependent oxidoreductase [Novosphingobium sp.]|uniref:NAD(P)H-dependent oxidoreductase n=1 Tax=Novosphingobium sp. TaxID=1874826 RepID=UPI0026242628|nr:NAD(P)H-dependent oxidoreductase [Novosphingobium sp.]